MLCDCFPSQENIHSFPDKDGNFQLKHSSTVGTYLEIGFVKGKMEVLGQKYPSWRYHKIHQPLIVNNTQEDEEAKEKGYDEPWASIMSNGAMINWYWDIEDMSPKQLVCYAKEEYGVELPVGAGQETLQKAIFELTKFAPQNRGRMVLMAHTIRMNYEETQEEIRRWIGNGTSQVERMVVEL